MKLVQSLLLLLGSMAYSLCFALGAININTADAKAIAEGLTGVGLKKAERIVAYREQHGPFRSADELVNVKGIGDALLDKNRDRIAVSVSTDKKDMTGKDSLPVTR